MEAAGWPTDLVTIGTNKNENFIVCTLRRSKNYIVMQLVLIALTIQYADMTLGNYMMDVH
jgi:hypothetical protein